MCLILSLVLSGCTYHNGVRFQSSFSSSSKQMKAKFSKLSGKDAKAVKLKVGQTITFDYDVHLEKGSLNIVFQDSKGNIIMELDLNQDRTEEIMIEKSDTYHLVVAGEEAKGSYDIRWEID